MNCNRDNFVSRFFILLILSFNVACSSGSPEELSDEKYYNRFLILTARNLDAKYELSIIALGGSVDRENKATEISVSFIVPHPLTIEEFRYLTISSLNAYQNAINEDVRLKNMLCEYPFPIKRFQFSVFAKNIDGSSVFFPLFQVASLVNGKINYHSVDNERDFNYIETITETYEEALQKLQGEPEVLSALDSMQSR
jgi:hypothetical protein